MSAPGDSPARSGTQALDRAVALLHAVAQSPPERSHAAQLARECGLTKATAWRLLSSLETHGLIERNAVTGAYGIGFGLFELASSAHVDGLVASARPVLTSLVDRTGETANLALYRSPTLRYVDEVRPASVVAASWAGRDSALHATSSGKALLAWLPDDERSAQLVDGFVAYTARTIVTTAALQRDLEATRARGWSTCLGEFEAGLNGVSAPLLDGQGRPVVVISLWGSEHRVPESRLPELGELVLDGARRLAEARPALRAAEPTP